MNKDIHFFRMYSFLVGIMLPYEIGQKMIFRDIMKWLEKYFKPMHSTLSIWRPNARIH